MVNFEVEWRFEERWLMRPTVIIQACPDYDPERIRRIIEDGLDTLQLKPFGRTLVPNCVASGEYFPNAYTRPEFLEGVAKLRNKGGSDMTELAIGERSRHYNADTFCLSRSIVLRNRKGEVDGLNFYHFDETPQAKVHLLHQQRLRDYFYTPEPVARADFFVNCPKFKAHPWTTVTFSMKNYIGIQDDRHRLIDHDHRLNEKGRGPPIHRPTSVHCDRCHYRR